jgi:hypothetical protein
MHPDAQVQKLSGGRFVGLNGRDAQDGVPAAFDDKAVYERMAFEGAVEFG